MRLVETLTLWGNLYRRRFYVDGKQVTSEAFHSLFYSLTGWNKETDHKATSSQYRNIWTRKD